MQGTQRSCVASTGLAILAIVMTLVSIVLALRRQSSKIVDNRRHCVTAVGHSVASSYPSISNQTVLVTEFSVTPQRCARQSTIRSPWPPTRLLEAGCGTGNCADESITSTRNARSSPRYHADTSHSPHAAIALATSSLITSSASACQSACDVPINRPLMTRRASRGAPAPWSLTLMSGGG